MTGANKASKCFCRRNDQQASSRRLTTRTDLNESSLDIGGDERLVLGQSLEEFDIRMRSDDLVFSERFPQDSKRFRSGGSVDDEFGDQRVVEYLHEPSQFCNLDEKYRVDSRRFRLQQQIQSPYER